MTVPRKVNGSLVLKALYSRVPEERVITKHFVGQSQAMASHAIKPVTVSVPAQRLHRMAAKWDIMILLTTQPLLSDRRGTSSSETLSLTLLLLGDPAVDDLDLPT